MSIDSIPSERSSEQQQFHPHLIEDETTESKALSDELSELWMEQLAPREES